MTYDSARATAPRCVRPSVPTLVNTLIPPQVRLCASERAASIAASTLDECRSCLPHLRARTQVLRRAHRAPPGAPARAPLSMAATSAGRRGPTAGPAPVRRGVACARWHLCRCSLRASPATPAHPRARLALPLDERRMPTPRRHRRAGGGIPAPHCHRHRHRRPRPHPHGFPYPGGCSVRTRPHAAARAHPPTAARLPPFWSAKVRSCSCCRLRCCSGFAARSPRGCTRTNSRFGRRSSYGIGRRSSTRPRPGAPHHSRRCSRATALAAAAAQRELTLTLTLT